MRSQLHLAPGLSVPLELATEAVAILGTRGRGKTNTAVVMVEEMISAGIPVAVVDTVGVWWGLRSSADGQSAGLPVVIFGGEHADVPLEESAGKVIADIVVDRDIACVIDTSMLPSKAAARRFLLDFVTRVYTRKASKRTPLHLVFDEADELAPQRTGPDGLKLLGAMEDFVRRGRSRGLGVTMVTQRPAVLNKDVLTQAGVLVAMGMSGLQDVKAIDEWVRLHADPDEAAKVKATLAGLPVGTGWFWSPQWLGLLEQVKFRARTTFDSSATPKIGEKRVEPKKFAQIDLAELGEQIAATVEKQKADDPKELRRLIAGLEKQLRDRPEVAREVEVERVVEIPVITDEQLAEVANLRRQIGEAVKPLSNLALEMVDTVSRIEQAIRAAVPHKAGNVTAPLSRPAAPALAPRTPRAVVRRTEPSGDAPDLRAGARRMVETLGRMHPLRLTKTQWGTVSQMMTTSGTWSTYLGDIRRLGFIDENSVGFTLTPAGFDYLGGQPEPMTPQELQDHYRTILRAGARRMLDAVMAVYPGSISRDELGEVTEMATTSGTFSTYLGDLTRNGLVARVDGGFVATDILMLGSEAVA